MIQPNPTFSAKDPRQKRANPYKIREAVYWWTYSADMGGAATSLPILTSLLGLDAVLVGSSRSISSGLPQGTSRRVT
jgi:hypothetical protein